MCHLSVFWQGSAFCDPDLPWRRRCGSLSEACLQLTDDALEELERDPDTLHGFLSDFIPGYPDLLALLPLEECTHTSELPERLGTGVPGRKWTQMTAFVGTLPGTMPTPAQTVVDWCSGKSHLGRALAHHWQCALHGIERQPTLCAQGATMAAPWVKAVTFSCKDVLRQPQEFFAEDFVIALHACGDLHRELLRQWRDSDSPYLTLVPCCYQLWLDDVFVPLSQVAQSNDLVLNKNQVRLAVQEMVTSSERERRQSRTIAQWRMAFDLIQQALRGVDEYLPTPSLSYHMAAQGPENVIRTLAGKKNIHIPAEFDLCPYLERAERRFAAFRRLQLVAHGFRRALELWLVLDLALYLEEGDCQVELTTFCSRDITPRNIRIFARRNHVGA
ncbi:methyltransferase [Microbulbifer pacificus]|uniref:methyltransferase n=1 Tax=Microbulbifer pacificus TaxID=407164 RepID=UPI00131A40CD|nr:methyltransferase [Microbulbifer pacificus]